MDSSYTRSGLSVLSDDSSDAVTAYRTSIRNLAAWAEANAALRGQGLLSARPSPGKAGTFYKATDDVTGVLYYDNGTTWETVGASAPTDGSAATPSLRTLGSGSTQAAAGNHSHAVDAAAGVGSFRTLGTGSVQAAAGNHSHSGGVTAQYAYKPSETSRSATTTLTNDPDLAVTLAVGTWLVDVDLVVNGGTGGDFLIGWAFGGTATTRQTWVIGPSVSTTAISNTSVNLHSANTSWNFGLDTLGEATIRLRTVQVVTASGTFTVKWAQNTSNGTASVVRAGSHVVALAIA